MRGQEVQRARRHHSARTRAAQIVVNRLSTFFVLRRRALRFFESLHLIKKKKKCGSEYLKRVALLAY